MILWQRNNNSQQMPAVRGHMIISGRQSHTQGAVTVKAQAVAALRGYWKRLPTMQHLNQTARLLTTLDFAAPYQPTGVDNIDLPHMNQLV